MRARVDECEGVPIGRNDHSGAAGCGDGSSGGGQHVVGLQTGGDDNANAKTSQYFRGDLELAHKCRQLVGAICLVLGPFLATPAHIRIVEADDHDIRLEAIDGGNQLREQAPHGPDRITVGAVQTGAGLGVVAAVDE